MRKRHTSAASSPVLADKLIDALERFLHVEALSGIALIVAAAAALIWANGPAGPSYHAFWDAPLVLGVADFVSSLSLHFWVNDGLMTIFFLVVGLEIRREIHDGALASPKLAALPLAAALGGIVLPALIYWTLTTDALALNGWAVPTATDIAFAVGVLALLGKSIPANARVLLLALAVIDDIAAVIVIALFYSSGIQIAGLGIAALGVALVIGMQRTGVRSAWAYVIPGGIVWIGMLQSGIHPTLAGVLLGLLAPATAPTDEQPPVVRVQLALHPWVAFVIMPLFALANAGVVFADLDIASAVSREVAFGVGIALVVGKPVGVMLASWLLVRLGWGHLPEGVTWSRVALVGCLAGIGFTMAIFIANLAFADAALLGAAKLGILVGSALAALLGLALGIVLRALKL